jgi:hypothetical protein
MVSALRRAAQSPSLTKVGLPKEIRHWKGETVFRMAYYNLTPAQMEAANHWRHLKALAKIHRTIRQLEQVRKGYISDREIAKAAKASAKTVRDARKISRQDLSLQLQQAITAARDFHSSKDIDILFSRNSLQPKQPTAKDQAETKRRAMADSAAWQAELDRQKGIKGNGESVKLNVLSMQAYIQRATMPGKWKEEKRKVHKRIAWKKADKNRQVLPMENAGAYRKFKSFDVSPPRDFAAELAQDDLIRQRLKHSLAPPKIETVPRSLAQNLKRCAELAAESDRYNELSPSLGTNNADWKSSQAQNRRNHIEAPGGGRANQPQESCPPGWLGQKNRAGFSSGRHDST